MISLDHVLLLEQKVESAVAKIAQLQAENDALRSRCSELTNALSSKSEQLSSFESDQNKIESGILKALDRLNSIENSVLKASGQMPSTPTSTQVSQPAVHSNPQTVQNTARQQIQPHASIQARPVAPQAPVQPQVTRAPVSQQAPIINGSELSEESQPGFFDLEQSINQSGNTTQSNQTPENGQFDIF